MTRHDTAQQTTDSSSSQHNLTHDTTRRDATASMIHVCAGWQVRHLHAAMQDHRNTAVLSVGLGKNGRPGTGHREWSSVVSGGQWAVGSGHWWCLSHRQVCYCFVDGRWPAPREHRIRQIRANATHRASPPSPSALRPHLLVSHWST